METKNGILKSKIPEKKIGEIFLENENLENLEIINFLLQQKLEISKIAELLADKNKLAIFLIKNFQNLNEKLQKIIFDQSKKIEQLILENSEMRENWTAAAKKKCGIKK